MLTELIGAFCERRLLRRRLREIQSETLSYSEVMSMLDTFGQAFDHSRSMILGMAPSFFPSKETSPSDFLQVITLRFLLDRVTSTPVSILRLILSDPVLAASDGASLHRSAFEAAINFLYLARHDQIARFRSYYVMSFESERRTYDSIHRWRDHTDQYIALYAEHQLSIEGQPTDDVRDKLYNQLGITNTEEVARYPNILQRCADVGSIWEYFYDSKYRGLSAWHHGDTTRAAVSSSLLMRFPQYSDRPVFESLIILVWTWELIFYLICTMADFAGVPLPESIKQMNSACHATASKSMHRAFLKYHFPVVQSEAPTAE